jgi:hypothetical protein
VIVGRRASTSRRTDLAFRCPPQAIWDRLDGHPKRSPEHEPSPRAALHDRRVVRLGAGIGPAANPVA